MQVGNCTAKMSTIRPICELYGQPYGQDVNRTAKTSTVRPKFKPYDQDFNHRTNMAALKQA